MPAASEDPAAPPPGRGRGKHSEVEPDSIPLTPPNTDPTGGERRGEGPPRAEREERSHSPRMSVPHTPRIGRGPGERDVTTSIGKRPQSGATGGIELTPKRPGRGQPAPLWGRDGGQPQGEENA